MKIVSVSRVLLSLCLLLVLLSCREKAPPVPSPALRVVSLTPATTEILFAIGAGPSVVGVTDFCNWPEEAKTREKVGGFSAQTVSLERVLALKPDLVILSRTMHERLIPRFKEFGIRVLAVEPRNFADVFQSMETIGAATGHEGEARELISSLKLRLEAVQKAIAGKPRPRVFWELWDEPLMTTGGGTFIAEAIERAGGENIFGDLTQDWPEISFEQVLARTPEWILGSDDHGPTFSLEALRKRPLWASLPPVQEGKVAVLQAEKINRGGPRLVDAVEELERLLH